VDNSRKNIKDNVGEEDRDMGILNFLWRRQNPSEQRTPTTGGVRYSGGQGASMEDAVVIHADSSMVGVLAEYGYVTERHGRKGTDWVLEFQALIEHEGKHFDCLHIKLTDGCRVSYYFDISEFFGKF
jgi:hypothetical protein